MVEFADFNHAPTETPMTETTMPLIELLQKQDDGVPCAPSPRRCCSC